MMQGNQQTITEYVVTRDSPTCSHVFLPTGRVIRQGVSNTTNEKLIWWGTEVTEQSCIYCGWTEWQ